MRTTIMIVIYAIIIAGSMATIIHYLVWGRKHRVSPEKDSRKIMFIPSGGAGPAYMLAYGIVWLFRKVFGL